MQLNEYQSEASKTARFGDLKVDPIIFLVLCLSGETGEVAEKVKKAIFKNQSLNGTEFKESIILELGDVLWYLSQLAKQLDINLEDVAKTNLEKINSRARRNVIGGEGDNR